MKSFSVTPRSGLVAVQMVFLWGLVAGCQSTIVQPDPIETPIADLMYELLQGEMRGFHGDLSGAFHHYYQASLLTDDPDVASRATEIALWIKHYDHAAMAASRWCDLLPDNPHPVRILGSIHAIRKDIPAALEAYERSIDLSPGSLELDLLAIANSLSAELAQPVRLQVLQALAQRYPDSAHAHLHVAGIARLEGHMGEALEESRLAVRLFPEWTEAIILQADILRETGRVDEAVELLRKALSKPAQNEAHLRQMLADLLNSMGRRSEAHAEFLKLLESDPQNPHLQMTLGSLALLAGDREQSEAYFLALISNPRPLVRGQPPAFNRSVSMYFLGLLAEQAGDPSKAIDYYYRVEERNYFEVDRYYQKARVRIAHLLLEAGQLNRARMHLRVSRGRSLREENVVQLYVAEGDLLHGLKQYDAGFTLLSRALEKYPKEASLLYSRALLAERLGRIDLLEKDLRTVLEREPDHPQALNALGYTWADHNLNLNQALEYIKRAHVQLPNDAAILDSLGWAHYRLGDLRQAEALLRQALSIQPDGEIVAHLVEVLWSREQYEEARKIYREAIDRLPDNEFLSRVAQRFAL